VKYIPIPWSKIWLNLSVAFCLFFICISARSCKKLYKWARWIFKVKGQQEYFCHKKGQNFYIFWCAVFLTTTLYPGGIQSSTQPPRWQAETIPPDHATRAMSTLQFETVNFG
jgi:hypothetical protein